MKIAVTYENGEVFQHFGHTEAFKLYEVGDGKVLKSEVISAGGAGCGALAGFLAGLGADVLLCGGIGGGAMNHVQSAGIELISGVQGDADAAVEAYLRGELLSEGANCSHHEGEEGHHCHDDGGEGHHCHHEGEEDHHCHHDGEEGGHHCCGGEKNFTVEGKNAGKTCRVHYRGTFNDGSQFDSSYDRNEPLEFVCGAGSMIKGFDAAVAGMEVGEIVDVHLTPEEAYGPKNPNAILTAEIADLPGSETLSVGDRIYLSAPNGQPIPALVIEKDEKSITFDANHEMAGRELNFRIELVGVDEK
ncbi:MAG: FKBP-type peptidyl-prolyl cis-trans isomerase [Lachnospiraceae bacterium]|nr:FKBP-type peptidyl-prolyl cis-trans isomerase [Lachnospiraceae bacterium]